MGPGNRALFGVHTGANWQIPLNHPCAAALLLVAKLP